MDAIKAIPTVDDVYEPPRVDLVLTAEELAREVQYAGDQQSLEADFIDG